MKLQDDQRQEWKGRLAVTGLRLLAHLPTAAGYAIAEVLGRAGAFLPLPVTRVTRINLELCFPELSRRELRRLLRQSLVETAKTGIDMAACWHRPEQALARVRHVIGGEDFEQAVAEGRPVVLLAPHLGCWEAANFWVGRRCDLHALFKPSPLPPLDDLICRARQHFGTAMHSADGRGLAGLIRAVREGAVTGILPDQVPARDAGRFAPFFGRPAWTGTLAAKLIKKTGARAFVVFVRRLPDRGLELVFRDPDPDIYADDPDTSLAALNRSIEAAIRETPAQYLWCYRRFRRRPEGMPNVYAAPVDSRPRLAG